MIDQQPGREKEEKIVGISCMNKNMNFLFYSREAGLVQPFFRHNLGRYSGRKLWWINLNVRQRKRTYFPPLNRKYTQFQPHSLDSSFSIHLSSTELLSSWLQSHMRILWVKKKETASHQESAADALQIVRNWSNPYQTMYVIICTINFVEKTMFTLFFILLFSFFLKNR